MLLEYNEFSLLAHYYMHLPEVNKKACIFVISLCKCIILGGKCLKNLKFIAFSKSGSTEIWYFL